MSKKHFWMVVVFVAFTGIAFAGCSKNNGDTLGPRTPIPDAFVGTWYNGDISNTDYYNPSNGSWNNAVGSNQSFTFKKDGTFEFGFRAYVMVGNCSNVGMAYRRGTVVVSGNKFTLTDNYSKIMEQHACNPSSNYDKNGQKYTEVIYLEPATDQFGNPGLNIRSENSNPSFFIKK